MHGPMPLDAFAFLMPGAGTATDTLERAQAADPASAAAVRAVLDDLRAALLAYDEAQFGTSKLLPVAHLSPAALDLLDQVLGEGEVKALVTAGESTLRIQESTLSGVWRVHEEGGSARAWVEVADFPAAARLAARALPLGVERPEEAALPDGVMNVRPVMVELDVTARDYDRGGRENEINLTLLPMTPPDLDFLDAALGIGPVDIVSKGYGKCRIVAAARRHVWSVRFYNSEDKLLLNTIVVGDVPVAARATAVDMRDAAERLGETLAALFV